MLKRINLELYHHTDGKKVLGENPNMSNSHPGLSGNCSYLKGDCAGLTGNCSGLWGDCSDVKGVCSDLEGCLDIDIERPCDINDMVEESE